VAVAQLIVQIVDLVVVFIVALRFYALCEGQCGFRGAE